ncbi:M48 family metallopeptidase [Nitrobacter winogradskyi]|uniref:Heat shock protein HtpX n=2 Tax=Nitrobacter winogradskyi TaxID=913 RepID=A0ACC6AHX3_NITWI|nr:M48 family metallopeptidase [Nitrobacter winogradskyi]MCP1999343.1 heat shock protein HtpX [Nitrobacter winogradskyi]GEC14471.1 protease HtpX [Nitrobacter winogradskyi]
MAAYGLYTHIASNKIRSMFLLGGLFVLIYVMVFAGALIAEVFRLGADYPAGFYIRQAWHDLIAALPWATAGSVLWIVIAYFFHQSIIDAVTGGHDVSRKEQPRLYNLLENLCISRGIPMPKLKVMDTDALNAFATGLNRRQYAITVTTGLMNGLNDEEMEAVLGHELTHIRNGDVQLMVVAVIIAGVVGFVAELCFRTFLRSGARLSGGSGRTSRSSSSRNGKSGGAVIAVILAMVLIVLAWFLSQVVRMALSRSRELMADAGSVELTKNPDAMISALRKIENRGELPGVTSSVMEMCVDNPRQGFADLFATHPSVETRVRALVRYAGGRDPGPMQLPTESAVTDPELPDLPPGPWSKPPIPNATTPDAAPPPPVPGPWSHRS